VAERFELYVAGMELANAYTELNDPDLQEELFRTQLAGLAAEESMARMDTDFIRALRHGMPPAGGLGIGIDRLVMFLTAAPSIRDVILFPIQRPEVAGVGRPRLAPRLTALRPAISNVHPPPLLALPPHPLDRRWRA
jgi:lysyl-tRNA synthetase, class II